MGKISQCWTDSAVYMLRVCFVTTHKFLAQKTCQAIILKYLLNLKHVFLSTEIIQQLFGFC